MTWSGVDERGLPLNYGFKPEYEATPREVKALLDSAPDRVLLVDCRTAPEWEVARVPGSVHVPLDELDARVDELPVDGREVFVLCHHGVRSMKGTLLLRSHGIENARSVAGGIDCWSLAADAGVPRYERSAGVCRPLGG